MTGLEYEYTVADYLRSMGYTNVSVTKGSGDFGIDVIAFKNGHKYAVQCKYYRSPVSLDAVQEAVAGKAMYGCDCAMVVTNNTFTKSAKKLANRNNVVLLSNITDNHEYRTPKEKSLWIDKFNRVNSEIVEEEKRYYQTGEHYKKLDVSSISGLPHKFTIMGESYDIDKVSDIERMPLNFSAFSVNGTKYYFNNYFRLCAKLYHQQGNTDVADALIKKAIEIENDPLHGQFIRKQTKTVIKAPQKVSKSKLEFYNTLEKNLSEYKPPDPSEFNPCTNIDIVKKHIKEIKPGVADSVIERICDNERISTTIIQCRLKCGYAEAEKIRDFLIEHNLIKKISGYDYTWIV